MAQLKIYSACPYHVYDKRIQHILEEPRRQTRFMVYIAAYSKADAAAFSKAAQCGTPSQTELRIATGTESEALREAMLFENEGTVLVTSEYGGKRPVVKPDAELGAQAIGVIRPADGRAGYVFEATMARYAGRGSIAVGAEVAYVKLLVTAERSFWRGTEAGDVLDDDQIQRLLDLGELEIIRSGFGDWFTKGR
jgi:hypothetical protein